MALTGSYFETQTTLSATESHSVVETYPEDIPSDSPLYSKRGTTETVWYSSSIENVVEHSGKYSLISRVCIHNNAEKNIEAADGEIMSPYSADVFYQVYNSKEDRDSDYYNPLFQDQTHIPFFLLENQVSSGSSIIGYFYEELKKTPLFTGSVDI